MAKVGVITFLHNDNYGSVLQAYALQRAIRETGHECAHLDYCPDRTEKVRNMLKSRNNPKLILDGLRKQGVKSEQGDAQKKSMALSEFCHRRMELTSVCRNVNELKQAGDAFDTLVCGSDQIWNPVWINPAYFLVFAEEKQKKVAYAPSLGIRSVPTAAKVKMFRKWTKGFSAISVREEEGAVLLEQMTGRKAEVMPDPVCLLSRDEWNEIAEDRIPGEPYLLCYFIGENPLYWEKVRKMQQETGLRVIVMPVTAESYRSGFETAGGISPEAFLGAVAGAECFCTDSFHGLAFGTIFGVKTELLRRYSDDDPESKNSRVDHFQRVISEKGTDELREEGRNWLKEKLG